MTLYKLVYFVEGVKCTLHTDSKEYYESLKERYSESNTPDNNTDENVGG